MVVNIPGVIGIVVFYIIIVVIGIWAGKNKKGDTNDLLVAGRSLGMFVATLTTAGQYLSFFFHFLVLIIFKMKL